MWLNETNEAQISTWAFPLESPNKNVEHFQMATNRLQMILLPENRKKLLHIFQKGNQSKMVPFENSGRRIKQNGNSQEDILEHLGCPLLCTSTIISNLTELAQNIKIWTKLQNLEYCGLFGTYSSLFIKISFIFLDGGSNGIYSICQTLEAIIAVQSGSCYHIQWGCYQINLKNKIT